MKLLPSDIVTVVVPVYNRAELVVDTLRSIAAQTSLPSVVIVDNNSTDGSLDVVSDWAAAYGAPVVVVTEQRPGAAAARNRGLQEVTTPYVMFFDSDDLMAPDHVARLVEGLEHRPDADILGWDVVIEEIDGGRSVGVFCDRDVWFRHIFNATLSTQRYGVRTDLVRSVGGWDATLAGWNDYELGFRLLAANPTVVKLNGHPTVTVRRQRQSITGTAFSDVAGRWEASLSKCADDLKSVGAERMLSYLRLRRVVLAAIYAREGSSRADATLREALVGATPYQRVLLRFAYTYRRLGLRGIHLIMRPLL